MADFLKRNRVEVVKMCLYEYDEEKLRADEAFRKIAILEKQLAELMK